MNVRLHVLLIYKITYDHQLCPHLSLESRKNTTEASTGAGTA
jgi:hypothetical protein